MKKTALLATVLLALVPLALVASSEINYQGVLTDQNGNPVNGVRAMQIKIYDAPTGGTLLYSEDLGNVPVQDGIYSFSFGANGTSNALTTETVAIANGTVSTFQKVLAAPTVVAGSVTVTDGTYTWDQTNGSSNENDFSVAYSANLRRVTVTYYNGAPAAGKTITAKFRAPGSGIIGALTEGNQPWIEVSLAGVAQTPRQKVLTVPFAIFAASAGVDKIAAEVKAVKIKINRFSLSYKGHDLHVIQFGQHDTSFPLSSISGPMRIPLYGQWQIPFYVKRIKTISLTYRTSVGGSVSVSIPGSSWGGAIFTNQTNLTSVVLPVDLKIPFGESFGLQFSTNYNPGTGAEITEMSIEADVSAIVHTND